MTTVRFSTEPFTCPSCITKITKAVGRLEGVDKVDVMFNAGKVKVSFDENRIGEGNIAETITKLGYPVTSKHPAPVA